MAIRFVIVGGSIRVVARRIAPASARANAFPYNPDGRPAVASGLVATRHRLSTPATSAGVGRPRSTVSAVAPRASSASRREPSAGCSATCISSCAKSADP